MPSKMNSTNSLQPSTRPTSMIAASSYAPSPNGKASSVAASASSKDLPLRRTIFLLMTDRGFIADHSKKQVDDSTSFYTNNVDEALGFLILQV